MALHAAAVRWLCLTVPLFLGTPSLAQVYRCVDASGAIAYQSMPCDTTSGKGAQVQLRIAPADPEAIARRTKANELRAAQAASASAPKPSPAPAPPAALPASQLKSELDLMADLCLDWYRPLLKDPRGAYHRDAAYKDYVLSLTIYATNSYGGYVSKSAACEIKRGGLDEAWTKTHAKRHNWGDK